MLAKELAKRYPAIKSAANMRRMLYRRNRSGAFKGFLTEAGLQE
jgi:hypothetical protein